MTHRPAVWITASFIGGIICHNILGITFLLCSLVFLSGLWLAARRWRRLFLWLVLAVVFFMGAFDAWNADLLPLNHVARRLDDFKGRDCVVVCRVVSTPHVRLNGLAPKKEFLCDIQKINGEAWQGRVQVHFYGRGEPLCGDLLSVRGKISRPYDPAPGSKSSYASYLQRQGIYAFLHVRQGARRDVLAHEGRFSLEGAALLCREYLQGVFRKHLSPGEAGLMSAMLLGPRDDIPRHVYDIFRKTGTAHIIAISGMNMTLTAVGIIFILGLLHVSRIRRAWLTVFILGFYSLMAGHGAPVARSALMAAVVILSFILERETDALNSLAASGLVLLAVDPWQLHDVGFQLSFAGVASLILLAPLLLAPFEDVAWCRKPWVWFLIESAAVTLAAFIGSAGILAYDFGYLAPIGLLVNLPVIPLMVIVTALGFLVLAFGLILPWMVVPFVVCLKVVLNLSVAVLMGASHAPLISFDGMPGWGFLLHYTLLAGAVLFFDHYRRIHSRACIDKPLPL